MKILFIYPNILMVNRIPLGIAYMSSMFKKQGHDVHLFDTTFYKSTEKTDDDYRHETLQVKAAKLSEYDVEWECCDIDMRFSENIDSIKPDVVMCSITENMWPIAERLLKVSYAKGCFNIIGGPFPSVASEELSTKPYISSVCIGDLEPDINKFPFQDWSLFSEKHLWRPLGGKIYKTGNFILSKGCPYECSFCINKKMKGMAPNRYHREMNIDKALDEIEYFKKGYGLELINFHDETFLLMSDDRLNYFSKMYKRRIGLPYSIVTRINTITHEAMKRIVDSGCINVSMSIESGNQHIREKYLNRKMTNEQIFNAFKITKDYPVRVSASNIIGIPHEGRKEIFDTIALNKECAPDSATVNMLYPYRGTWIRDYCIKNNFMKGNELGAGVRAGSILVLPTITNDELIGIQRCFQLYMRFPESMYSEIRRAETDDDVFEKMKQRYLELFPDVG